VLRATVSLAIALGLLSSAARAAGEPQGSAATSTSADAAPDPAPEAAPDDPRAPGTGGRALATTAAIVPGAVVHGAGHYVLGDTDTARKLLIAEGVGAGMVLGGGLGLFLTGASRYTVVPFAALVSFGVGVFSAAMFADVYGSAVSDQNGAWSRAAWAPARLESELGYRRVESPHFDHSDFVVERFALWHARTRVEPSLWSSFAGDNARYRLELGQRLYGASPGDPRVLADFVEIELGLTHHRYSSDYFERTTVEAVTRGRYDLGNVGQSLRGAFVEGSLGYAINATSYDFPGQDLPGDSDDLLLMTMVLGVRLRGPARPGSEAMLFYDHRHDGFAAGMLMNGLGSGVAGHLGLRGRWFFDERYGVSAEGMFGSALVGGASILIREGTP
jgi:hypothetical protein